MSILTSQLNPTTRSPHAFADRPVTALSKKALDDFLHRINRDTGSGKKSVGGTKFLQLITPWGKQEVILSMYSAGAGSSSSHLNVPKSSPAEEELTRRYHAAGLGDPPKRLNTAHVLYVTRLHCKIHFVTKPRHTRLLQADTPHGK
jgi:hypothetical protein